MAWNWKKQASVAYGYALVHLTLNYCIYIDNQNSEETDIVSAWAADQLHQVMERFVWSREDLAEVALLRRQLSDEMMVIAAYMDYFYVYEHAVSRMERRIDGTMPPLKETDEECTRRLYEFVMSATNSAVMNKRIQLVMEQLPIRFTRQKFFSIIQEALSAYIGSDQSSLDQIMYLLRSSAMVELTNDQEGRYPQLKELSERLKELFSQPKTMDINQYKEVRKIIDLALEKLSGYAELYQRVEELVNDLYILILTRQDAVKNLDDESVAMGIMHMLMKDPTSFMEAEEKLYQLEGVQEQYFEKYQRLDPPPTAAPGELPAAVHARMVERLLSSSPFAELEDQSPMPTVTRKDVELAAEKFFKQLEVVFSENSKPIVRAVMAITLAQLPVCFNSRDELRDYIKNSLTSCTDTGEKETCMELLGQVMEMEYDALL